MIFQIITRFILGQNEINREFQVPVTPPPSPAILETRVQEADQENFNDVPLKTGKMNVACYKYESGNEKGGDLHKERGLKRTGAIYRRHRCRNARSAQKLHRSCKKYKRK